MSVMISSPSIPPIITPGQGSQNNGTGQTLLTYAVPYLREEERELELWLDVRSLHVSGPMTCLVCCECFINKTRLIVHYILNHGKAYCGTCRYLTFDATSWSVHWNRHLPLQCSQCVENFKDENVLRKHYNSEHSIGHCRLCGLMMPIGTQFNEHLARKHYIINHPADDPDEVWMMQDDSNFYSCTLCGKENIILQDFFRHYIYFHKFSLKCFSLLVNGKELDFKVFGSNISDIVPLSSQRILSDYAEIEYNNTNGNCEKNSNGNIYLNDTELLEALVPEIKQEDAGDFEIPNMGIENESQSKETVDRCLDIVLTHKSFLRKYCGREDFDTTLIEFISIEKREVQYVMDTMKNLNESTVTAEIFHHSLFGECEMICPLCYPSPVFSTLLHLKDHIRLHSLKQSKIFTCRLCMIDCSTLPEIEKHSVGEEDLFKDLYLCQLCDSDFKSRETARSHLSSHFEEIKSVTCTSPQLGLKCRYCSMLFWHEYDREKHHCETHYEHFKEQFYRCKYCEIVFSDKMWWASHQLEKHHKKYRKVSELEYWTAFKCSMCLNVFRDINEIREHFKDVHPYLRKLYCAVSGCISKPFKVARYLRQHHEFVHNQKRAPRPDLQCDECGKISSSFRAAATHRTVVHGNRSTERFKCRICNQGLPTVQDRNVHYIVVHPNETPFTCQVCGKGFHNKSALYTHRSHVHSVNTLTYTCKYCKKIFDKRDSYKEHLLIHIGPRHACPHCPRLFVQRSNMVRHARLHTGEKPYPCFYCEKTFADKGACNAHVRTHTKQETHSCIYCGQEFLQKQKLKYHLRKHTGEDLETCLICEKKFTNPSNLREHLKTHDDSNPAKCPQCDIMFRSVRHVERHILDKHQISVEVFPCPLCERSFPKMSSFRSHLLTHSTVKFLECLLCHKKYNCRRSMYLHLSSRHNLKHTNQRQHFNQLDHKLCGLPLDDTILDKIFTSKRCYRAKDLELPLFVPNVSKELKKVIKAEEADSDSDYKPMGKLKLTTPKEKSDDSDDNVPLSGLSEGRGRVRVKRETARNVNYVMDDDEEEDLHNKKRKKVKKKGKIKKLSSKHPSPSQIKVE